MSILTKAIRDCLAPVTVGADGDLSVRATFPADFVGFSGHFPGRPVLPGVCMIQVALLALAEGRAAPVRLKRLVSSKWLVPVLPGETLIFALAASRGAAGAKSYKVKVTRGNDKVAEFSIEVAVEANEAGVA